MSSLTSQELLAIVVIVVLGVGVVALLLFLVKRLRDRRDQLLHELHDRPELVQDRAFNRIAMARREAEILGRQGRDVGRARELIATAQAAFDTRSYNRAYESAQFAHESLVHSRSPPPGPARPGPSAAPLPSSPVSAGPLPGGSGPWATGSAAAPGGALPRNRAEAQFQLRLLDQELDPARNGRSAAPEMAEAVAGRDRAKAAFDRGDFTEAFRSALRARRALGGTVEGLPPSPTFRSPAGSGADASAPSAAPDAAESAMRVAGAGRCPECGFPLLPDDRFCRGCGSQRSPMACPKCGAGRTPADTFCGRCGERFS